jgi:hypothetical protein
LKWLIDYAPFRVSQAGDNEANNFYLHGYYFALQEACKSAELKHLAEECAAINAR